MILTINGQRKNVNCAPDIRSILDAEGFEGKLVAVARNGEFVPRVTYANTELAGRRRAGNRRADAGRISHGAGGGHRR
jgi:thiamine biosynthesis protein ThiS